MPTVQQSYLQRQNKSEMVALEDTAQGRIHMAHTDERHCDTDAAAGNQGGEAESEGLEIFVFSGEAFQVLTRDCSSVLTMTQDKPQHPYHVSFLLPAIFLNLGYFLTYKTKTFLM